MNESLVKIFQNTPYLHAIVMFIGTLISFTVSYFYDYISIYVPFVSETGAFVPSMCIFSLCLILGSFFGCLFIIYRYIIFSSVISDPKLLKQNSLSCIIGLLSMLGLAGVAAFPMTTVYWTHLTFATTYFVGTAIYFILVTFMHVQTEGANLKNKFRAVICLFLLGALGLLVIFFPISQNNWKKQHDVGPARKVPQDDGFTLILISSLLEWSIVSLILLFNLSLVVELKNYGITFTVNAKQSFTESAD